MRRKLEVPMDAAMPCKRRAKHSSGLQATVARPNSSSKVPKTRYACKVEYHASKRQRLEPYLPKYHEDHIAGKGFNSMNHDILVRKFIPMAQVAKIPDAKAAVDKEWNKLETISAWQLNKVKSKKEVIQEAQERQMESPLCYFDGHMSSQECGVRTDVSKIQGSSRTPR